MRQRRETLPHRFYMLFLCDAFFSATRFSVRRVFQCDTLRCRVSGERTAAKARDTSAGGSGEHRGSITLTGARFTFFSATRSVVAHRASVLPQRQTACGRGEPRPRARLFEATDDNGARFSIDIRPCVCHPETLAEAKPS